MGAFDDNKELSEREIEVVKLLAVGLSNKEIAGQLTVSVNTIKVHVRNIFAKLEVQSRTEAAMIAIRAGWIDVPQSALAAGDAQATPGVEAQTLPRLIDLRMPLWQRIAFVLVAIIALAGFVISAAPPRQNPVAGDCPFCPSTNGVGVSVPTSDESRWQVKAQMPTARTLLAVAAHDNRVFAIGGDTPAGVTNAVEAFNLETNTWSTVAAKPNAVSQIAAAVIDDRIIVPGGITTSGVPTRTVEIYHVPDDRWSNAAALPEPRTAYAMTAFDGKAYLFGGSDGFTFTSSAWVYDPESDTWQGISPMPTPRGYAAAAALDDAIYVVGGYDGQIESNVCERYLPRQDQWEPCPSMSIGRGGLALVRVGAALYAIGGGGWTGYLAFNEVLTSGDESWRIIPSPLTEEWRGLGAASIGPDIIAIGGWNGQHLAVTDVYNPFGIKLFVPVAGDG